MQLDGSVLSVAKYIQIQFSQLVNYRMRCTGKTSSSEWLLKFAFSLGHTPPKPNCCFAFNYKVTRTIFLHIKESNFWLVTLKFTPMRRWWHLGNRVEIWSHADGVGINFFCQGLNITEEENCYINDNETLVFSPLWPRQKLSTWSTSPPGPPATWPTSPPGPIWSSVTNGTALSMVRILPTHGNHCIH